MLDCFEFCTDEYKKELEGPRQAYKQVEDKKAGLLKAAKASKEAGKENGDSQATKKRPLPQVDIIDSC